MEIGEVLRNLSSAPRPLEAAQREIVEALRRTFGLTRVTVMLYNRTNNMLESVSAVGVPNVDHRNIRAPVLRVEGISSRAVEARAFIENRPIVVRDRRADPQYRLRHRFPHKNFSREFAVFPLVAGSRKIGILAIAVDEENPVRLVPRLTGRIARLAPKIARIIRTALPKPRTDRTLSRVLEEVMRKPLLHTVFQPIVDIRKGAIHGYESLLRVRHPLVDGPAALFSHAERLNRLRDLSYHSHKNALRAVPLLPPRRRLFLNLHPKDFAEYEDLDAPSNPFHKKDLTRLVFEITERYYLKNVDRIQSIIRFLKAFGVGIALDDLGSGYSSLEVLTSLEPDYIKIDMSLIRNIHENDRKQKMMKALLYYCDEIGAHCVAEGVEIREEFQVLEGMGCRFLQGFYLSRPHETLATDAQIRERLGMIRAKGVFPYRSGGYGK